MKNSEYWQERFKQMEEAEHDTSVQKVQEIQEQFERALAAINGKINAWYQRLANNNGVSMQEARKLLDQKELKEFHWNVEDYIKYAEENAISGAWEKQLENASARVHIGRLEALKIDTQQEMEKLYGNCIDAIDNHISNLYTSDFYHTAYEVQKGIGIGTSMNRLDPNMVEKIVRKPWAVDGKNFSDRLWENKTKLINNVHNSLTRMCITGESPDRAINEITGQMKVSKAQAGRVVMTESAAFANQAREDAMKELDVEQFEVVETLDSHTCELCGSMDGKHFPMSEYQIGVTVPPFHPNCRGCTCPYFDDEIDSVGERIARDENGENHYVPEDTTYEEWKNTIVMNKTNDKLIPQRNIIDFIRYGKKSTNYNKIAQTINIELDNICKKKSKWSGNINVKNISELGKKEWNCDVTLSPNADFATELHELIHARSISYYDDKVYEEFQKIEEGSVELLTEQICRKKNMNFVPTYQEEVKHLLRINRRCKMFVDDFEFAKELINVEVPNRLEWLISKTHKQYELGVITDAELENVYDSITKLFGGY